MSSYTPSHSDRDAKVAELHEQLGAAVEDLVTGEQWTRALEFSARFRTRSFNNLLLIHAQHAAAFEAGRVPEPTPTYVAGFKQWQALGRSVTAGQHGYGILAPRTARFASAEPTRSDSWRRLAQGERPRAGEIVRQKLIGVRPAYVWDVSQTEGRPIPERPEPRMLHGEAPAGLWDGLAALVQGAGYELTTVDASDLGGANGRTDFTARTVVVRGDVDAAAQVKTLAHELAHVRLHGPTDNEDAPQHRGIGEVEAESVALMIGAAHGMETSGYTIPYVSGWAATVAGRTPLEVVQSTGERVRRTAVDILSQLPTEQLGAGDPPGLDRTFASQAVAAAASTAPPNRPIDRVASRGIA
ncbi:ArdC-like ssDNA-binding domain-containing protein [Agromyces seonyuensis]|uniref:Serine/arginine repetitive matrix protein 2 n=1 Tax=Agromyces seonyuensis TaxID=2662446 RepID=A0A6I4NYH3_9MICO|nr:serine/arginine repetitive matrix protein 2 [Agromyces seonyuensis]